VDAAVHEAVSADSQVLGLSVHLDKPGSKIPTEFELSRELNISRVTVRKALAVLTEMGYLERKSGKGTFVAQKNDNVLVSNITERAKNKMKKVQLEVEKEYVFPFLTGNDLDFWSYKYSKYILCPHTSETKMYPINKKVLAQYPLTERYFSEFKKELVDRKGFTSMDESIHEQFFYTLQRIGVYTFARYKVCWRYICKNFTPAVVEYANDRYLGVKNIIGNEKIISIAFDDRDEAYYICAIISSTPYRKTIENYMVGTQITPSIIGRLNIPKFDRSNHQHIELSRICREGHFSDDPKQGYIQQLDEIINQWFK